MERIPEPELMDAADQAAAYAEADFSEADELFVELALRELAPRLSAGARWVDLGCGPADIPLRLCTALPELTVDAVDGSLAMLAQARRAIEASPVGDRVRTIACLLPQVPFTRSFDAVLSNSLLHHLHDPRVFWRSVAACGRPGAGVLVMDLARPADAEEVDRLVALYAADAPAVLRRDFRHSLHAAYTVDEVRRQLATAGLDGFDVRPVSDRHLAASGRLPG